LFFTSKNNIDIFSDFPIFASQKPLLTTVNTEQSFMIKTSIGVNLSEFVLEMYQKTGNADV